MKTSTSHLIRPWTLMPLAAALALSLSACGGGGGGGLPGSSASLSGAVIDAPIANATVTITTGAPLGQAGATTVGTITADAQGNYSVPVALPNTSVPVFANATSPDGKVVLTAYLGSSSAMLAAGTLSKTNLPNLVISQVTTAALAMYIANGGSYANLTPAVYAALLSQDHDDILAVSAAIKAVADGYCAKPSQYKDTDDMAKAIAMGSTAGSTINSTSALTSASSTLGAGCDNDLKNLMQYIASDDTWTPELDLGDLIEHGVTAVAPGTYSLQGVIAQSGMSALSQPPATPTSSASAPSIPQSTPLPPSILAANVTVDSSGNVASTDGSITGTIVGNLMTLTVKGASSTYTLAGKVGVLPSGFVSSSTPSAPASSASGTSSSSASATTGYALRMGGRTQAGGVLTRFDAVLVPQRSLPAWTNIPTTRTHEDGLTCNSGFGVRLMGTGATVGGRVLGACATPQSDGVQLSAAANGEAGDDFQPGASVSFNTFALSNASYASTPYILSAPGVTITKTGSTTTTYSGQMYYVMGAKDMIFSTSTNNGLFVMNENPLDKMLETQSNQDH
ncbi:hypothetical protein GALL_330430 [mine drainage metagenome]|uniref:Uncharacterized protein n=1 Tax=mine drainage metagenome TaxID=410659 RepID=A0A1J5QP03_9ZZZZ